MLSAFEDLQNERDGEWWKTTPLANVPHALNNLAYVAAAIAVHYVPGDWVFRANEGSVTFQNPDAPHEVVTVFVDAGNELAQKEGLSLHPDPIVVAIELTALHPFQRRCVRDYLRAQHGNLYCDPRQNHPKRFLQPRNTEHFFDILFLREGPCDLDVPQVTLGRVSSLVGQLGRASGDTKVSDLL